MTLNLEPPWGARCSEEERKAAVDIGRNYLIDDTDTFSLRDLVECEGGELLRFINRWDSGSFRTRVECKVRGTEGRGWEGRGG